MGIISPIMQICFESPKEYKEIGQFKDADESLLLDFSAFIASQICVKYFHLTPEKAAEIFVKSLSDMK